MERLNGAPIAPNKFPDRDAQRLDFVELSARGSTFNQWKMMGTLLWIHGKRAYPPLSPDALWIWLIASQRARERPYCGAWTAIGA
jgi:hypothetical protein